VRFCQFLAGAVFVVAAHAVPARAQRLPSYEQASSDFSENGTTGMRCDSYVALWRNEAATPLTHLVVSWVDGYVRGVGVSLLTATIVQQTPVDRALTADEVTVITAAITSAYRGWPPTVERESMATRGSKLSDYCQQHSDQKLEVAVGDLLMNSWLKLPKLPTKPK
jgi:hypothetical protein